MSLQADSGPAERSEQDRIAVARGTLSRLAGSYSERAVRPIADAVSLAIASFETGDDGRADALLETVDAYAASLGAAEAQLSNLERSVRADLASAATLINVRTDAHLSSAFDVMTATAAASAALFDVDSARRAGSLHDPVELLLLLGAADAEIDAAVTGYRTASEQARRQLAAIESALLCARIRCEAVAILHEAHPGRVSEAACHLRDGALELLAAAEAGLAGDPAGASLASRTAAEHASDSLDAALADLGRPPL
ncbi:hypothetical protein HQQ81_06165 [Microbacteriaceae bacterium VKM Ac-2854]|nr:hypothetical protein [Microbacteriaceae bacterium VKM Ac-2854]